MELHDAEEAMGIRKILTYDIRMKKNPQSKEDTFCIFKGFHGVYAATFSNTSYWLIFSSFFNKKSASFDRKL